MQAQFVGIFLLGTTLLQGDLAISNSPNSPHRKLSELTKDVSVLKQEIKAIQDVKGDFAEILKRIFANETQQAASYEQIKNMNTEMDSVKKQYEDFRQIFATSAEEQKNREQQLKTENEALKVEINNLKILCDTLTQQPQILEQKLQQLQAENNNYKQKSQEVNELKASVVAFQSELASINDKLNHTTNLVELQSDNNATNKNFPTIEEISTQLEQINKSLSFVKSTTDNLVISRENMEKYLQDLYAEVNEKFNTIAKVIDRKENSFNTLKEINEKVSSFQEKYSKLDTFNDVLLDFQNDLAQLKDSTFALSVSKENLEKNLQNFTKLTDDKFKEIKQAKSDVSKNEVVKNQLNDFKQELVDKCKRICKKSFDKTNEQIQSIVQQVQTKIDSLKSRTFSKHIILSGESLSSIAKRYSTSPEQILITNNIQSARELRVGDTIIVPNNI